MSEILVREMALDAAEFRRLIGKAIPGAILAADGMSAKSPDGALAATLELLTPRRIAGLSLPRARVTLEFSEEDAEARQARCIRFDRAFQKGGG